jgi:hypothetical protein
MKRIRSVTIQGKRWRVVWDKLPKDWGLCSTSESVIEMDTGIKDNITYATILIHEMCHAMLPNVEEDFITQMADDLAVALHRAGLIAEDE